MILNLTITKIQIIQINQIKLIMIGITFGQILKIQVIIIHHNKIQIIHLILILHQLHHQINHQILIIIIKYQE